MNVAQEGAKPTASIVATSSRIAGLAVALVRRAFAHLLLALLLMGGLMVNIWWVYAWRRGLPFDIDEAGYLQRALNDATILRGDGIAGLWRLVHTSDPQAPLLPTVAGTIHAVTGLGPTGLLLTEQLFLLIVAISTYALARRCTAALWPVLAVGLVLVLPGIVWASRSFYFAVPAAALLTAALAVQLWVADFDSLLRALMWGVALGLAMLTRSMIVGLLPGLVLAACLRVAVKRGGLRRLLNVGGGLAVGAAVAAVWYSASWRSVITYLQSYGYGANASAYGSPRPLLSWDRWSFRLTWVLQTDVFVPLTMAFALCLGAALGYVLWHRWHPDTRLPRDRVGGWGRARAALGGDVASMIIVLSWGYLALSSTTNLGSGFEVPLLPVAVVLVVAAASRVPRPASLIVAFSLVVAGGLTFADQTGLLPGGPNDTLAVTLGSLSVPVFDGRGMLLSYASETIFGGCPSLAACIAPGSHGASGLSFLRQWIRPPAAMASLLEQDAAAHGRSPVVFFSVQDPFFNTNTVALAAQEMFGQPMPVGLLQPSQNVGGMSFQQQLEDPRLGEPNLVILGPPSLVPAARAFSPVIDDEGVIGAVRADGFAPDGSITLPDGRVMQIWWKDRGPLVAAP